MKIVEIIPHLTSGGAERFTVDLCNELAQRHEVWLILFFPLADTKLHFLLPDVSKQVRVVSLNKHLGIDLGLIWRLRQQLVDISPDIVHCHGRAFEYTFFARLLSPSALKNQMGSYYTVHSDAKFDASRWTARALRRYSFRRGMFVAVAISEESLDSFRRYYGFDTPMITNGRCLPDSRMAYPQDAEQTKTPVLVSLARFSQVKRQDMLARIAKRLEQEGHKFILQFIGQHQEQEILDAVKAVDCKSIEIVGEVSNPLDYLSRADAFCLCSSVEGMPISLIEAMAMGAVPVCTPVGGILNIVSDGVNGILSDDISEEAYYRALKVYFGMSKDRILDMSQRAVEASRPYSMKECAGKYEQLWFKD